MKQQLSLDFKSIIIGALASLLVVVALGNSPVPEPLKVREYQIVHGTFSSRGPDDPSLPEKVNTAIKNGWQPIGGLATIEPLRFYQVLVK